MNILTYLKNLLNGNASSDKTNTGSSSVNSGTTSATTPADKLKELENYVSEQYESYFPGKTGAKTEVPSYERYEYTAPTDEEIAETAKAELGSFVSDNEKAIYSEYEGKEKELSQNKASSEKLYKDSGAKLKSAYDQAAQALSDDSLKRGLARSSIALNNQAAANKAYAQSLDDLMGEYNLKIAAIDEELNSLDGQLQNALNSFKISYAAKLTERINELKSEREDNVQKAIEYNNSLKKDEFEQGLEKEKTDSELYSESLSQMQKEQELMTSLTSDEKAQIEKNIYNKVVEILDSMPFEDAKELFLNEPIFRESLSDYYYYTLYYKYR